MIAPFAVFVIASAFCAWAIPEDVVLTAEFLQPRYQVTRLDSVLPAMKSATIVGPAMRTFVAIIGPKLLAIWAFVEQLLAS